MNNLSENKTTNLNERKNETMEKKFIGEVTDRLIDAKTGELIEERVYNNLVVDSCSTLISGLMKGALSGIQYFAVGSGSNSWNNASLPEPANGDTKLLNETFRKQVQATDIKFIDSSNQVSTNPTNRLQVSVTFDESEANGELRELGIFGGNATATRNSGYMLNRKIHALIYKTNGMKLERIIRFTF